MEISGDIVEANAAEAHHCFCFAAGFGNDHNRPFVAEKRTAPSGVFPLESNVDGTGEVGTLEIYCLAHVENLSPLILQEHHFVHGEAFQRRLQRSLQIGAFLAIFDGVVNEVVWCFRLIGVDQLLEVGQAHGL